MARNAEAPVYGPQSTEDHPVLSVYSMRLERLRAEMAVTQAARKSSLLSTLSYIVLVAISIGLTLTPWNLPLPKVSRRLGWKEWRDERR